MKKEIIKAFIYTLLIVAIFILLDNYIGYVTSNYVLESFLDNYKEMINIFFHIFTIILIIMCTKYILYKRNNDDMITFERKDNSK